MSSEPVISEPQQRGELSDMSAHGFPEQGGFIAISASWSPQHPNLFRHLCWRRASLALHMILRISLVMLGS